MGLGVPPCDEAGTEAKRGLLFAVKLRDLGGYDILELFSVVFDDATLAWIA